jgi:hypothetical protein
MARRPQPVKAYVVFQLLFRILSLLFSLAVFGVTIDVTIHSRRSNPMVYIGLPLAMAVDATEILGISINRIRRCKPATVAAVEFIAILVLASSWMYLMAKPRSPKKSHSDESEVVGEGKRLPIMPEILATVVL